MSLFEKINKKILVEQSSGGSGGNDLSGLSDKEKKNINKNRKVFRDLSKDKDSGISKLKVDKKFNQDISQRRTAQDRQQQLYNRQYDAYDDGDLGNPNQSKTQTSTKGNETVTKTKTRTPRKGVDFFADPPEVVKARRQKLIQKRKYYEIDRKGNITDKGVEKYARNIKQSNLPLTQKDLSTAKKFAVGGEKIKNKAGEVIGTTTGKYGGKLAGTRKTKVKTQTPITQTFVNKTKQNRELQRQSRLNQRTITTNVKKNPGLSGFDKGQLDFDKNLQKLKSKKNTVYVDKTPSFGKEGSGMSFKDLQKQLDKNTKKSFIKTPDPIKIDPIKTNPLRKPFDPLKKTRNVTKTLKALKKPTMLGKLVKASPYVAVAGILGTNLYNRIKKSQKTKTTTTTPKPIPVVPSKFKDYKVDTTRLSFAGLDGGRISNDQFGNFKKS